MPGVCRVLGGAGLAARACATGAASTSRAQAAASREWVIVRMAASQTVAAL